MSNANLVGTWRLASAQYRRNDGSIINIYGDDPDGMLMYDADGNMSVQIMARHRPQFAVADRLGGTPEQIQSAFQGYQAYYGTYSINENEHAVIHHLAGALLPNWVGVEQKRFFDLTDNRLTLRTPPLMIGGKEAVGYLVWQRSSK